MEKDSIIPDFKHFYNFANTTCGTEIADNRDIPTEATNIRVWDTKFKITILLRSMRLRKPSKFEDFNQQQRN